MTREEAAAAIAPRLQSKVLAEYVFSDIAQAVLAMSGPEKAEFVASVQRKSAKQAGDMIMLGVKRKVEADALAEADNMVADDNIDIFEELERLL